MASAAELREPHRVARYLETLASAYHKFYDACRVLPMGDEEITELHRARLALCAAARQVLANGLGLLGVSAPERMYDDARASRPGRCTPASTPRRRRPARGPVDAAGLDELAPAVWPRNAARGADGALRVAGVDVRDLAEELRHPAVRDRRGRLPVPRRRVRRGVRRATSVHYAAKAFLCTEVARWVAAEGLSLDVCSGGELAVALRAGFPAERIALHGNNKSVEELTAAVDAGVGRVVLDSFAEIARLDAIARERGVVAPVMVRLTVGVEAHTHEFIATAHEDQKFGFSIAGGEAVAAAEAVRRVLAADGLALVGLHSHIGSQIFDTEGFEVAAHRVVRFLAAAAQGARRRRADRAHHAGPRRRLRHRLPRERDPARRRAAWPRSCAASSSASARAEDLDGAGHRRRAGPGDRRAGHGHALRGRHAQGRAARRTAAAATSASTAG